MTTDLTVRATAAVTFTSDQIDLIKRTLAKDASTDELRLFLHQCQRTGLDPMTRQIYCMKIDGRMTVQISIDGFRVIANRTGELDGIDTWWCAPDGVWRDVWLEDAPPAAAKVTVYRKGCSHTFTAVARWREYAKMRRDGTVEFMWAKMPALMLAKACEALALRKAFPAELSGLYAREELDRDTETTSTVDTTTGEVFDVQPIPLATPAPPPSSPHPPVSSEGDLISLPQRKRLYAIAKQHGWSDDVLKDWLASVGFSSTGAVTKSAYQDICAYLEQGPPPLDAPAPSSHDASPF